MPGGVAARTADTLSIGVGVRGAPKVSSHTPGAHMLWHPSAVTTLTSLRVLCGARAGDAAVSLPLPAVRSALRKQLCPPQKAGSVWCAGNKARGHTVAQRGCTPVSDRDCLSVRFLFGAGVTPIAQ